MTKRSTKSKFVLLGGNAALLFAVCCSTALASSGIDSRCSELGTELSSAAAPATKLDIKLADHGLIDAAADMNAPATGPADDEMPSTALAEVSNTASSEVAEKDNNGDDNVLPVSNPPGTALRLPGVSDKDLPRFRRQMNRTDI